MLTYEKADVRLTAQDVRYWKRIFRSNLKIGVEIETNFESGTDSNRASSELRNEFSPTNNVALFGKSGVYAVKGDGSLSNGLEICTVGRRLDFIDLYMQYRGICTKIFEFHPVMNQRAGLHNHVLLDYSEESNCLEKPVPGIIFKNFMQLIRRHLPELVWITSTVKDATAITRYDQYCQSSNIMGYSPLTRDIASIKNNNNGSSRYQFINLYPLAANSRDEISKFHFEFRFPDGSIWPAQIAAQNILYSAMLIKAIELSENGVINSGNREDWVETKELFAAIRNNGTSLGYSGNRLSNPINETQMERIKERGFEMLIELKPQLDQHDKHVYQILKFLNEKPISILRREMEDNEINQVYNEVIKSMYNLDMTDCSRVTKAINTMEVVGANNQKTWEIKLAEKLECKQIDIQNKLFKISQVKPIGFDSEIGTVTWI